MSLRSLLNALKVVWGRSKPVRREAVLSKRSRRLDVEALEDRCLPSFTPVVNYPVLSAPWDAVVGDLNGDTIADIATINASQLSVLSGNTDGTFDPAVTTTIGNGIRGLAAGDFDRDGRLDLATSSTVSTWTGTTYVTTASVNILLNNGNDAAGNALFQAAQSYSTGTNLNPGALLVGDLNGDTFLDAATLQTGGSNVTVLLGNGNGALGAASHHAVDYLPRSLAAGYFNDDTRLDLVTANEGSGSLSVLINDGNDAAGNVAFQTARNHALPGAASVAVGDIDDNGVMDLVASANAVVGYYWGAYGTYEDRDGFVNVLLGDGNGGFASPQATWANLNEVGDVDVGDFNGDEILDVVVADGIVRPQIDPTVLLGHGNGTFDAPYHFVADYGPGTLLVRDFNGDNAPDVATANIYASTVSVLLNANNWPPLGAPYMDVGGGSFLEGNDGTKIVEIPVTLTAAFSAPISVNYRTLEWSAIAGLDYEYTSGTLQIAAGHTTGVIQVRLIGDRAAEVDESFSVILDTPTNARLRVSQGWSTIRDDEPRFRISDATVTEGHQGPTNATFTVSLETAYDMDVSINFATTNGSASAGSDYEAASGTVIIKKDTTTQEVVVAISGDRVGEQTEYTYTYYDYYYYDYYYYDYYYYPTSYTYFEANETFSVNLSGATIGAINDSQGVGTIVDDEPRISIVETQGPAPNYLYGATYEGNSDTSSITFTINVSDYDEPVTVTYATANDSATSGVDYAAKTGAFTFNPTDPRTRTITIDVVGDRATESDEIFSVNLTGANYGLMVDSQAFGTILNDEPLISISEAWGDEGNSGTKTFTFWVTLSMAYDETVTVKYATQNGSASSGSDYQAISGTVTFLKGETSKPVTVKVVGDTSKESMETFSVVLSSPTANASLYNTAGWGYIYNDDAGSNPGKGNKKR